MMLVLGAARFESRGYRLRGATITVTPSGSRNEEIVARGDARLTGEQVDMRAPAIRLFIEGGNVDRLVALAEVPPLPGGDEEPQVDTRGLSPGDAERARDLAGRDSPGDDTEAAPDSLTRPVVVAQDFHLTGDSIEVKSPGQRLDEVVAVGDARAESTEDDSLRTGALPDILRRDWIVGDTIVARFGPAQPPDSGAAAEPPPPGAGVRLETLTGSGRARSLYRMFPGDTTGDGAETRPAIHLVEGEMITIHLDGREVVNMDVVGQTEGWHFEPQPPDSAVADSTVVDSAESRLDSAAVDTTAAKPDTAGVDTTSPHTMARVAGPPKPQSVAAGSAMAMPGRAPVPTTGASSRRRRR